MTVSFVCIVHFQWNSGDAWPASSVCCCRTELLYTTAQSDKADHRSLQVPSFSSVLCHGLDV